MAKFAVRAGKKAATSEFTLTDKTGRNHPAKRHVFHDTSGNQAVAAHVAANNRLGAASAIPTALKWKKDFEDPSKPNRRHVINLVFKDAKGRAVMRFDPPVELRIMLTPQEQASKKVELVHYHPKNRKWQAFADTSRVDRELVATISEWFDDPGIGLD
jgi:hypothetical protein